MSRSRLPQSRPPYLERTPDDPHLRRDFACLSVNQGGVEPIFVPGLGQGAGHDVIDVYLFGGWNSDKLLTLEVGPFGFVGDAFAVDDGNGGDDSALGISMSAGGFGISL